MGQCKWIMRSGQLFEDKHAPYGKIYCVSEAIPGTHYCPVHTGPPPIVVKRKKKAVPQPKFWEVES